jgi:peroxiredoxin
MGRSILGYLRASLVAAVLLLLANGVSSAADPAPEELLKGTLEFLGQLSAASATADVSVRVRATGRDQTMESTFTFRAERPDKWAQIIKGEPMDMTVMSDGKQLYQFVGVLNRYTVTDATEPTEPSPLTGFFDFGGAVKSFDAQKIFESIAGKVTESKYLGREKVGDVECHRCRFDSKAVNVDVWFEVGDRPLVWKVVPDLTKTLATAADGKPAAKGMQVDYVLTFTDWNVAPKFTAADFTFTPPEGAEKVESLFGGGGRSATPEIHPLVGKAAPPIEAADLAGDKFVLANHLGEDVVMLDFWATWCGPCVAALPEVNEVAKSFADRGVVFYAVNVGEDKQTISDFLKEQELDVPVLMDEKSAIAAAYKASGIPQTVLIGKDGTVQVVHVGFGSGMKKLLSDELEKLLAGEDLAKDAVAKAAAVKSKRDEQLAAAMKSPELKSTWTYDGGWSGVVTDPKSSVVYAISPAGSVVVLDAAGKERSKHEMEVAGTTLRLAEISKGDEPELLNFGRWSSDLIAANVDGNQIWSYPQGDGIDDVWAADLDGDGQDEVIVGFNGGTGLHVLDAAGKPRWKNTDLGNVWHVSAGDMDGDGTLEVVTTSAQGDAHVFAANGEHVKDISMPLYANMIRTAKIDGADKAAVAVVAGSGEAGEELTAVDLAGKSRWTIQLPLVETAHVDSMSIATDKPWAAVGMRDGLIHVVVLSSGEVIAHARDQGQRPEVAWLQREGQSPLLLVANGDAVQAFVVEPAVAN